MTLKDTPTPWRRGFRLYRRRKGTDSLGNETSYYPEEPDLEVADADGIDFQSPQSWNSAGKVGSTGHRVEQTGEVVGGVLEGYLRAQPVINPYDRLELEGEVWEVRATRRWPGHRQLLLQRVR